MAAELHDLTVDVRTDRWHARVLTEVSLSVAPGEITALVGGPGAGKSMIARALTGRLPASATASGEVVVDGIVGYVPQDGVDAFAPGRPVGAQLRDLAGDAGSVEEACAAAAYPAEPMGLLPEENSAGQIQRAALAAALMGEPDILVADGPTAPLDRALGNVVWRSLRRYADAGGTLLVITHDLPLITAAGLADRIVVVDDGRVLAAGTPAEVAAVDDPLVRMYF
ncbi:peptide/nickel transport system ATP-binding protein [Nocardioides albertanoniae]|uniref:Peptide/nickel transport system ATP-binding protein n=1 Tax=Nocardioides albertanoniae TaxID=1175486 RepID=A0A543A2V9_9ACTN|nr:ATP-binding cassette domain-containing protein [Nocardioides albertanoniae]TQL66911.1 peptide/nickel transport system ATP-binding protein [Nocardioides albertanoniae]